MATIKVANMSYNTNYGVLGNSLGIVDSTVGGARTSLLYTFYNQLYTSGAAISGLFIYQGVPATQADIDGIGNTTAVTAVTGVHRYADLLCYLPVSAAPVQDYLNRRLPINFTPAVAIQSGTATWFILGKYYYSGTYAVHALLSGSLGAPGSGADLELDVLNLTAGTTYKRSTIVLPLVNNITY